MTSIRYGDLRVGDMIGRVPKRAVGRQSLFLVISVKRESRDPRDERADLMWIKWCSPIDGEVLVDAHEGMPAHFELSDWTIVGRAP